MVSVKGLSSVGGVTRLAYTVESGGVGPWGGAPRAMLHEAGQYCFINVSKARTKREECEPLQNIQNEEDTSEVYSCRHKESMRHPRLGSFLPITWVVPVTMYIQPAVRKTQGLG